ncbi:MAG: o-succinylbenzoate synthase [Mycobacterium sp.]
MQALIDFDRAPVFAIPATADSGAAVVREGMLLEGPQGWGEFSPAVDANPAVLGRWLTAAVEGGTVGWPDPVRGRVPVAVRVPAVDAVRAHRAVIDSGCAAADVVVGFGPLADDIARVAAVRDAVGPTGGVRCDAGGRWNVDDAVTAIEALDRAAGGLQYIEQPCGTTEELAAVRRRVDVPVAVDESLRNAADPSGLELAGVADVAVLSFGPMGGARRALRIAEACGLPCVVTSTGETSIGLAGAVALAGVLPELPYACGLGSRGLFAGDVVPQGRWLIPVDGHLPVAPMPPGPDPGLVERFALADPDRVTWWRQRLSAAQTRA